MNAPDSATEKPPVSAASEAILSDDFQGPLSVNGGGDRWRLRRVGSLPFGDGIVSTGPEGLVVVPTGVDPVTGDPAFAGADEPLGEADHIRWALMANAMSACGFPGFDAIAGLGLQVSADVSVRGYGLERHPYGDSVPDPGRDLRLGAGLLVSVDMETGIVLDFIVTDRCVFAVYERLALPGSDYAAFSYAVPVADREPEDVHALAIVYDCGARSARWYINGSEMLIVDQLGCRLAQNRHSKRDNGKREELAAPRQLMFGVGLFTDRLWGQGFRLAVRSFQVHVAQASHGTLALSPYPRKDGVL